MNLLDFRTGRAIRALRRGHVAAEAFGVHTPRAKMLVFIHAAVLAGLSGWLYAHLPARGEPDAVRRAGRHRISLHRRGRRRRLCLGRRPRRGARRGPEGSAAELPAADPARLRPGRNHRVRHHAGGAAPARARRRLALADVVPAPAHQWQEAGHLAQTGAAHALPRPIQRPAPGREGAEAIRRRGRGEQRLLRRSGSRDRRADRSQRRRQEHHLQPDHRRAVGQLGLDLGARQQGRQGAAAGDRQARHLPHLPARQAGARYDRAGERRDRRPSARPFRADLLDAAARPR